MNKVILAAAALAALALPAHAQQTVRIGTEGAYAPWNFVNEAGQLDGYEIDLGNAICEQAGLTCEFVQNDWDSIIPNLIAGNYDVIMAGMSITEERQQTIDFTQDYFPPDPSRFVATGDQDFDFSNLSGLRIGVQSSTIQEGYAQEHFAANNTIVAFASPDQSVADLAQNNIDLLLADGSFLEPIVGNSQGAINFVGEEVLIGGGVGAGLRKEDTDLRTTFDDAITALKEDGTVATLISKWFDN